MAFDLSSCTADTCPPAAAAGCLLQDCVNKTIARIKSKLEREDKRVLNHVVYGLRSTRR